MSKLMRSPKALTAVVVVGALFILGVAGGALGNQFGGGFLGAPLASIQIAAEPVSPDPVFGFRVTNTMVAAWIAIAFLALVALVVSRRVSEVPGRFQGLVEVVLEFFLDLAESVAGPKLARRFFPLVMTIFLFIVTANWMGILPGFGTIGWVESPKKVIENAEHALKDGRELDLKSVRLQVFDGDGGLALLAPGSVDSVTTAEEFEEHGVEVGKTAGLLVPFLRGANTDINVTLGIALVAMVMVHWWALTELGIGSHVGKFLNFRGGPIGLFVGVLEAISEVARVISFTFRLFGNIFAGEVLLIAMAFLVPLIGLVPFLGLELFVGAIQAFIFAMLTLVFAATASVSHGDESH